MDKKNVYILWIWWIGISAIARYYLWKGYNVYWSDQNNSVLIQDLASEWCFIKISDSFFWWEETLSSFSIDVIIYTEAVPLSHPDLSEALRLWIPIFTYPETLAHIANDKKLIAIAGTHGKSTTTSLTSLVFKKSKEWFSSIVWSLLKEFWWKNFFSRSSNIPDTDYFIIEACEYKRSFLRYKPAVWVIINIEIDHLDYYKDLEDYISAYRSFIDNIRPGWFCVLNWEDNNCKKLLWSRTDINFIEIYMDHYIIYNGSEQEKIMLPEINMQVPWSHILFDAYIAYVVWIMAWIHEHIILDSLEEYTWIWRRMEKIWTTENWNLLMSDYWHHPTEISLTLKALKEKYTDKKIYTVFQPHQYNRTLELLEDFQRCFWDTDTLVIPNIYESRDSETDKQKINSQKLVEYIDHDNAIDWEWLDTSLQIIQDYDKEHPDSSIILLLWAWNIDWLRYKIKTS